MPTYEYQCGDCSQVFDVYATLKEKEAGLEPECPRCHSRNVRQVFRSLMFVRPGGGGAGAGDFMPAAGGCGPVCGPGSC